MDNKNKIKPEENTRKSKIKYFKLECSEDIEKTNQKILQSILFKRCMYRLLPLPYT